MADEVECPACGAKDDEIQTHKDQAILPMEGGVTYVGTFHTCASCHLYWGDNDDAIEEALGRARQHVAFLLIQGLRGQGITDPYFERVLSLPFGTLKRWEVKCPPEGLALLRLTKLKPELLDLLEPGRIRGRTKFMAFLDDKQSFDN
jgi:hypothetical protein